MIPIVIFGRHKCGSQFIRTVFKSVCDDTERSFFDTEPSVSATLEGGRCGNEVIFINYFDPVRYAIPEFAFRGLHIVRDPRDILISQYHSHFGSHPDAEWLEDERAVLRNLSQKKGLDFLINESSLFATLMDEFRSFDYDNDQILTIKLERFQNFDQVLTEILEHTDVQMDSEAKDRTLKRCQFRVLKRLHPGHYRNGSPQQWKKELDTRQIDAFIAKYGDVIDLLEYKRV